jgi:hypothetical protein
MSEVGAGLTAEDVQREFDSVDTDTDTDADANADASKTAAADSDVNKDKPADDANADAVKPGEAKAGEADAAGADKTKADDTGKEADENVIRELREQNKVLQSSLNKAVSDYQKLNKVLIDKGVITEEEAKLDKENEEKMQAVYAERQNKLNEMVAIMELNPTFSDVRQVCTQGNLDDIVDAFSRFYVKENGGDVREIASRMEQEIWAEANPYKRIYELVKAYHPRYAKKDDSKGELAKDDEKKEDKAQDKKAATAKDINPSAATLGASGGGSGAGNGGWTAAKIDALDEDELSTVPKDIYEKYLANQLN